MGRLFPTPSDDGAAAWREFARVNGCSYTAVMEALAGEFRRMSGKPLSPFWRRIVEEARIHDAENRSREKPG